MASSYGGLLATVKAELMGGKGAPQHRTELFHALDAILSDFQSFLVFPGPRAEDRAQVTNLPPTALATQDVQIALRLSDDFNLNEVYCAGLVMSAHEKWNLHGGDHLEIMRISAGLWFTERDSLITSLQLLLQAVVLDKELDPDFVAKIRLYIENFLDARLRTRLMSLIKELNEEDSTGIEGHGLQSYICNSTGALVQCRAAIQKTRLSLCHCLYLSCHVAPINAQEVKDLYNLLKFCSGDESLPRDVIKLRIAYTIMFSLTNALVSGAQLPEETGLMLALDVNFCQEFQQLIMEVSEVNAITECFTGVIRLAWVIVRTLTKQVSEVTTIGSTIEDDGILCLNLNRACDHDVFGFLNTQVFGTAAFQNDERVSAFKYMNCFCKLIMGLLALPAGRQKIMELKYTSMMALNMRTNHLRDTVLCDNGQAQNQAMKLQAQPLVSFLYFARDVFQRGPELVINNNDLWSFVYFVGEGHTSYFTLVAFLDMLIALAECKEGAGKVYDLLQRRTISNLGWQNLFSSLVVYDQQFRLCTDASKTFLPPFQEGDARVVEAYLKVLKKVIEKGDALQRMQWFEDIEPLFKLLSRENVPPFLKGALRNAIAACASVSFVMKEKVRSLLEQYDLPVLGIPLPTDRSGHYSLKQFYDITYELNEVEARQKEYLSTLSYLKLHNVLIAHELDTKGGRYFEIFQFVRDQVFGLYSQRLYANPSEKWELVVAALHHFEILLSNYDPTNKDVRNNSGTVFSSEQSSPRVATTSSAAEYTSATPIMELMKDLKNGKVIYSNLMSILMLGVESVLEQRASQLYGPVLEEAVSLSFQIFIHAFLKESLLAEAYYPLYQSLREIIFQDSHQVVTLLEYVRYDKSPLIQHYSVKMMELLSARVPQLVSVIQEAEAVLDLTVGYAACLEARILEDHPPENLDEDTGLLILRLLLVNLSQPSPNLTHLLLGFDVNQPVERTTLQSNRHFSCLWVMLHALDTLARPEVNAGLHELGFELLYELCVDPVTCGPMMDLLQNGKYNFLPKRTSRTSQDTCIEKGNSSMSGTDVCSSEAHDLDLLTCDFEPAAGSVPEIPSNSKPEIGFLNPAPLATRCTTKENDEPGEGNIAALRSSWIQRLFPGMLGGGTKPSQWKEKEKHLAPVYEDTECLLIENAGRSSEDFGSSPQIVSVGQDRGRESCYGAGRSVKLEEGSSMELVHLCSNSSQPPPDMLYWEGSPASEGFNQTPQNCPRQQDLMLQNRIDCDATATPPTFTEYGEITAFQSSAISLELNTHDVGYSEIKETNDIPSTVMEREAGKKMQASSIYKYKHPVNMDTGSNGEHHDVERQSLGMSNDARKSQRQGWNRYILSGPGTSNKIALETELPPLRYGKSELQPGGIRNGSYTEGPPTAIAVGGEGPRGDDVNMDRNSEQQAQHNIDKGENVGSLGSSPLPPLVLFAPFKNSKERRSAEPEGKFKFAPRLSGESLLTPLFPSCGYKQDNNGRQGGADVSEDKFDSTMFSPYKPLSSLHKCTGIRGAETPLTLTPIFAPFKTGEEQNRPSASSIKSDSLPLDPMVQDGEDAVGQDTGEKLDVVLESKTQEVDHRGQSGNQLTVHQRTSSVYSSSQQSANQREAVMFSLNSGPRFNGGQYRVGTVNMHGSNCKEGRHTVNTTAIELSSRRPSLQEERTDDRDGCQANKDLPMIHSHDVRMSVSQGMRDLFQFDQDLRQRHLNTEAGTERELSSGSSPVPGDTVPSQPSGKHLLSTGSKMSILPAKYCSIENCQQDGLKIEATSSSVVKGGSILDGLALVKDAEREQSNVGKETRGGTVSPSAMAQRSEGVFPRRESVSRPEGQGLSQGKNLCGQLENVKLLSNAQEDKPERSSRKRNHETRSGESKSAQNSETLSVAVRQKESSVEGESRTTPRAQAWLQRWMPSSKPRTPVFKEPESLSCQMPPGEPSSHAKNRRLVQDIIVHGERLDEAGPVVQEQHKSPEMDKAASNSENYHRRSSPFCPGLYPVPSAAAMALVGAASRRAVPLPPQRVGTRIAVWPAIAGIQLRRTESGASRGLSPQVEVKVVVEEG